jgi:hypothetical protein
LAPPWNFTVAEARDLYRLLMRYMRTAFAVSLPKEAPLARDPVFAPRNREYRFRFEGSDASRGIFSWLPGKGRWNSRSEFLSKLLKRAGREGERDTIDRLLSIIWSDFMRSFLGNILNASTARGNEGTTIKTNLSFWKVKNTVDSGSVFICSKCRSLTATNIRGVCPVFNCDGALVPLKEGMKNADDDHYKTLYRTMLPINITSKEHTAQLTAEQAAFIQQQFIDGNINILSCSTTFELGVDLGELETVFMRNVPPEPSNYIQRAGRAGRRTGAAGFTLTFAQLRSHDQTYFFDPMKLIRGSIPAPLLNMENERIVRRHLHSVVLAEYFRINPGSYGTVESFLNLDGNGMKADELEKFLSAHSRQLLEALEYIVPAGLHDSMGIQSWEWIESLCGTEGFLRIAEEKVRDEYGELKERYLEGKKKYFDAKDQREANRINIQNDFMDRRMKTLKSHYLLDFLSASTVIPKYGFPVDIVSLEILDSSKEAKEIALDRDLRIAISEYAPGAKVVANGLLWTSGIIKQVRNRALPRYLCGTCEVCGAFHLLRFDGPMPQSEIECGTCGEVIQLKGFARMVVPIFGFSSSLDDRPERVGT